MQKVSLAAWASASAASVVHKPGANRTITPSRERDQDRGVWPSLASMRRYTYAPPRFVPHAHLIGH
jgi:hypothetical protein